MRVMGRSFALWLDGELPDRNQSELVARTNKYGAGEFKRKHTRRVAMAALKSRDVAWVPMRRFAIQVEFVCGSRRKDPDNILGGLKYLLDGLTDAGVVEGDRWSNVLSIQPTWTVDKLKPGVRVLLVEC